MRIYKYVSFLIRLCLIISVATLIRFSYASNKYKMEDVENNKKNNHHTLAEGDARAARRAAILKGLQDSAQPANNQPYKRRNSKDNIMYDTEGRKIYLEKVQLVR
jgi:ribosomal protein L44E